MRLSKQKYKIVDKGTYYEVLEIDSQEAEAARAIARTDKLLKIRKDAFVGDFGGLNFLRVDQTESERKEIAQQKIELARQERARQIEGNARSTKNSH